MKMVLTLDGVTYIGDLKPLEEEETDEAVEQTAPKKHRRPYKPDEALTVWRDREDGMSYEDISQKHGRNIEGIRSVISDFNSGARDKKTGYLITDPRFLDPTLISRVDLSAQLDTTPALLDRRAEHIGITPKKVGKLVFYTEDQAKILKEEF